MRLLALPKSYCLLITHLNGWIGGQYLSCWSPCFGFFEYTCYSKRKYYSILEKPGAQNIAVFENQGKQHELSDHWKSKSDVSL